MISTIAEHNLLKNVTGADKQSIADAEHELGVFFNDEFKELLFHFGACIYDGHEINGICQFSNLNVLNSTKKARKALPNVSSQWYVIEDTHFDSILVWQSDTVKSTKPLPLFSRRK